MTEPVIDEAGLDQAASRASRPARAGRTADLSGRAGGLEAPHRRLEGGSRILERTTVRAYRATSWVLAHLPPRPAWTVIGWFSQASYVLWPKKRRWIDANFAHVLRRDPGDRAVRRLALRAYGHYARYLVEVMRLSSRPPEVIANLVDHEVLEDIERIWHSSDGVIFVLAHVGNNEAVAAGIASRGWPISVVADDSSFPEMFELFRELREANGIKVIPWRNLRQVFAVLRRKEMLALLVDWGYRSDGIPVRLFDAWTALPAGPAALAAKTGATIVPITIRRIEGGRFRPTFDAPIRVASTAPAELRRATQEIAHALERTIGVAPDQWYSFKPLWPESAEEADELAARAATMEGDGASVAARQPILDGPARGGSTDEGPDAAIAAGGAPEAVPG